MTEAVLRALAAGGRPGMKLATIICRLVVKAGELGELEAVEMTLAGVPAHDGAPASGLETHPGKRLPRHWLERLGNAVESGSLEHLGVDDVVDILLQGPR